MSHKVIIELEFEAKNGDSDEEQTVMDCDVYDYLEDLIEDETLDYTVTASTGYKYGVIKYTEIEDEVTLEK